jgi:hypothetical protein
MGPAGAAKGAAEAAAGDAARGKTFRGGMDLSQAFDVENVVVTSF